MWVICVLAAGGMSHPPLQRRRRIDAADGGIYPAQPVSLRHAQAKHGGTEPENGS